MKGSWKLVRLAGIDVRVHWTFLLLIAFIVYQSLASGQGASAAIYGVLLILAVFVCVVMHEFGHALTARRFGVKTRDITLLPIGGLARLEGIPKDPVQELLIAIAGPAVNVVIAAVLFVVLLFVVQVGELRPELSIVNAPIPFLVNLLFINLLLVAFNLLPAFPMDGGRMLRALLAMKYDYARATQIAASVGQMMAVVFAVAGIFGHNFVLLLIAMFVFMAAGAEASEVRFRESIAHVRVRDAMMTEFHTLSPDDPIQHAADQLLAGSQQDFPVVDETGVVGLLTRQRLIQTICQGNHQQTVGDAMLPVRELIVEDAPLGGALQEMQRSQINSLPVVRDGRLVGLLTGENINEWIMLHCPREPAAH